MDSSLIRALVRAATVPEGEEYPYDFRTTILSASAAAMRRAAEVLRWHRLVPLVSRALHVHGLEDSLPDDLVLEMRRARRQAALAQTIQLHWTEKVLAALEREGTTPVLWKGAALVNLFYPDVSSRQIGDLDLLIQAQEKEAVQGALRGLGFTRLDRVSGKGGPRDGCSWVKQPPGIEVDVHHRCRLFEQHDDSELTVNCPPRFLRRDSIRVYEPNAMLVHLIVHMNAHRPEVWGYFLPWVFDVAFLLRTWGDRLSPERLNALLPSRRALFWLLRTAGFLEAEMKLEAPEFLSRAAGSIKPYTLDEVLRSRRMRVWGLPGWRGWARFTACRLGLRPAQRYPRLVASDPFIWPLDRLRERVAEAGAVEELAS